jgi:cyanophycinase-like exopeptidase
MQSTFERSPLTTVILRIESRQQLVRDTGLEPLDFLFIPSQEMSGANYLKIQEMGLFEHCQMARYGRLRQAASLGNLASANSQIMAVFLVGKIEQRIFQPLKNFSSERVRYRLKGGVESDLD